jgi:ubiquinol-cytochrome c reductase cytochrome c subunit
VSWITARRRHPAAGFVVIAGVLVIIGTAYGVITGGSAAASQQAATSSAQVAHGRDIFIEDCATCHGLFAEGTSQAPSLIGVGAAAVNFQVGTGRMPLAQQGAEADQKPPRLNPADTAAVAAYIQSLGGGPTVPSAAQVSSSGADIGLGQQLFVADCAACHNFVGAGGALTYGKYAPALTQSTPTQIY